MISLNNVTTVSDLSIYWLVNYAKERKSPSSIKRDHGILKNYVLPQYGNTSFKSLKASEVEAWLGSLLGKKGISKKSANDILILFNKIMNDAVRWDLILSNPLTKVTRFKTEQKEFGFWKQHEVKRFLGSAIGDKKPPRIYWPVAIALYTGMRRGEIQALQWKDINESSGLITVQRSYCRVSNKTKETKSKKIRYIPISLSFMGILEKFKKEQNSELVVPFFNPDYYRKDFINYSKRLKLPIIRFHDLRHTFASNFLMGGGNIYDLQKILGHSTIQMTERYLHLVPSHLKGKTEVLGF